MSKILVVDDSPTMCDLAREVLFPAGYKVACALNGQQALDLLNAGMQPDLILLDLVMPVLDGPGFVEAIRDRGMTIPVLIVSAHMGPHEADLGLPVVGSVHKPFRPADLVEAVLKALESKHGEKGSGTDTE